MTRIAVASDSHGGMVHLERFAQICRAEGYDQIYHLGDVLEDARWLARKLDIPVTSVAGNCDFYAHHPREARLTVEGKRLLLVHGDRFRVKYGCDALSYYAEENAMDAALFGHTHRPFAGYVGRALLINPGALRDGSYCELEITKRDIVPRIRNLDEADGARDR